MVEHLEEKYKKMILDAMNYHFPGSKVILFGSRARRTHKPGADIDIAVEADEPIDFNEMYRARVTLEHLIVPFKIDLVDMNEIPAELQETIREEGIIWRN